MAKNSSDKGRRERFAALQAADKERPATAEPQIRNRPANENDPATAMMLARLRRPPSYNVYVPAIVISIVWGFLFLIANKATVIELINGRITSNTNVLSMLLLLFAPMAVVFTLAYYLWHAQRMRQVSEILVQSSVRLLRPQDVGQVGQNVEAHGGAGLTGIGEGRLEAADIGAQVRQARRRNAQRHGDHERV